MFIIITVIVLFLDQFTKALALKKLAYGETLPVIKNIFHLTLVANSGSAFGLFRDSTVIFIAVTIIAVIFILRYLIISRRENFIVRFCLYLILGGALGNLIDRLRFGCVVDFLDFRIWPVFNLADSCITVGAIIIGWRILTQKIK